MKDTRHPWYLVDILVFLVVVGVLVWLFDRYRARFPSTGALTWLALALASYRLPDIISTEEVTSVIREPVKGEQRGFKGALWSGLRCPSCTGVLSAVAITGGYVFWPEHAMIPVSILALSACERLVSRVYNYLDAR